MEEGSDFEVRKPPHLPSAQACARRLAVKQAKAKDVRRVAEKYLPQQYKQNYKLSNFILLL
jgi:hypothetical protein